MSNIEKKMLQLEVETEDSNCRLGGLNFDCLEKIFESLCTRELINVCAINPTVRYAVKERVVRKRMISFNDWNRIWDTETIFKEFGEWIKHMSIAEDNLNSFGNLTAFDNFLQLLAKYCTKNRLQTLSMHFDIGEVNKDLLNASKPYFTNLRQIHYSSVGRKENSGHEQLFAAIIDGANELESIQLENTWSKGTWLQHNKAKNIQSITLIDSSIFDKKSLDIYFNKKPAIKTFAWINASAPNHTLCENVIRNCPNLDQFVDVQYLVPDGYLQETYLINRYNYMSDAQNLKCARITSFCRSGQDLISFFAAIARKNTLQNLSIHFIMNAIGEFNYDANRLDLYNKYPSFTSLHSLDIQNNSSCMFWSIIIVNFMSELLNLQQVSISGHEPINPVQMTRIALAPTNLKVLKINNANTPDLYMAIYTIGKVIEENQGKGQQTITIIINPQQNLNLQGYNISKSIKIIVV